jgi:hypothetical protein
MDRVERHKYRFYIFFEGIFLSEFCTYIRVMLPYSLLHRGEMILDVPHMSTVCLSPAGMCHVGPGR